MYLVLVKSYIPWSCLITGLDCELSYTGLDWLSGLFDIAQSPAKYVYLVGH